MSDPRRDPVPMREAQHSFDVVLRGFDRSQVAETIERLEADINVAFADRDAAMSRSNDLASQLSAMHAEIDQLRRAAANAGPPTFENMSERISHMLRLAEEEAAEIRSGAQAEADALRQQTAAEERAMVERHAAGRAEVERLLGEARQNAEQIASKAQIRADDLVTKAQEKGARLDAESQARRTKVDEDFEVAQRARRTEAARADQERERAAVASAQARIGAAEEQAATLLGEAEVAARSIRDVRDELTGRLLEARRLLDSLPDLGDRRPNQVLPPNRVAPGQQPAPSGAAADTGETTRQATRPPAVPAEARAGAHRTPPTGAQPAVAAQGPSAPGTSPQGPSTNVALQAPRTGGQPVGRVAAAQASGNSTAPAGQQPATAQTTTTTGQPPVGSTQLIRPVTAPQPTAEARTEGREVDPPTRVQPAVSADAGSPAQDSGRGPAASSRPPADDATESGAQPAVQR